MATQKADISTLRTLSLLLSLLDISPSWHWLCSHKQNYHLGCFHELCELVGDVKSYN